jgi:hypothetical protein
MLDLDSRNTPKNSNFKHKFKRGICDCFFKNRRILFKTNLINSIG